MLHTRQIFSINLANPSQCAGARADQGRVEIKDSARGKEYIWHWTHGEQAGRKLYFNSAGKLEQITAASGATLALQRGPAGEMLKVTDPQGRTLSFKYASKSQVQTAQARPASPTNGAFFAGIQSIDSPVGRYGYQHGPSQTTNQTSNKTAKESPNPTLLIEQAANLIAVSIPTSSSGSSSSASVIKSYHYEDARFPQALTGISINGQGTDAQTMSQRLSTYLYNPRGQAVLSVKGEPARLEADKQGKPLEPKRLVAGTGVEQVHVHIIQPALHNKAGSTVVTNSEGQQTLYRHQIIGGEYRLLEARGAGCASCGPVNMAYSYDSLGRQTGQTSLVPTAIKDGQPTSPAQALQTTRTAYTAQGAPMDVTTTGPQVQYSDPRWPDKPTLLVRPSVIKGQASQTQLTYNDYGQTTQISQTGFSPIDAKGQLASSAEQASKIERTTKYTYQLINNRSMLVSIDGPLPNGPKGTPEDSDITTLQYDQRADYLTATTQPGGFKSAVTYDSAGRIASVKNAEGSSTQWTYSANQLSSITSTGPGWAQPRVQSFKYDGMRRVVETGSGGLNQGEQTTTYRAQTAQGFDVAGRPVWAASSLGMMEFNRFDTESRLLQTSRASNAMAQTSSNSFLTRA